MPIYTFTCPQGHVFDEIVRYDTAEFPCPECKKLGNEVAGVREGIEVPARRDPSYGIM